MELSVDTQGIRAKWRLNHVVACLLSREFLFISRHSVLKLQSLSLLRISCNPFIYLPAKHETRRADNDSDSIVRSSLECRHV